MDRTEISTHLVRFLFLALAASFIAFIVYGITALSIPIAISFILSFMLNPVVDFLEGLGISRIISVIFVLTGVILIFYLLWVMILPMILKEINQLVEQTDYLKEQAIYWLNRLRSFISANFPESVFSLDMLNIGYISSAVFSQVKSYSQSFFEFLPDFFTNLLITPIIIFIFLLQGHEIYRNLISMVPNRYFEMVLLITHKVKSQISSYLKGLAIQWTTLASIMGVGFNIVELPYGPAVGIAAATVNVVPYLGPVMGLGITLTMALLGGDPENLIPMVLIVIGIAQLVDNVFTQPVVLARSVQLHPLVAILALITFQKLLGIVGMVIAIPLAGVMMVTLEVMYRSLKSFRVI